MALNLGANIGLNQGYSSAGSVNDAMSWSSTDAQAAREWSEKQATIAFERQRQLMAEQQAFNSAEAAIARNFNSEEAQKARDFNEAMANSIYTRSTENMKAAGINPILASGMGLSGANVASAQTASIGQAQGSLGTAPLAQNFMDAQSGSKSHGGSWENSEQGLITALNAMGKMFGDIAGSVGSALDISGLPGSMKNALVDALSALGFDMGNKSKTHTSSSGRQHGGSNGRINSKKSTDIILDVLNRKHYQ